MGGEGTARIVPPILGEHIYFFYFDIADKYTQI
jgi:hypothetical protein